ncbi:transposase [Rhodobacter capsulatus]|uniref:transposase n=1 Tax=Rhodobacter capsulatus TaxID=1061 RepID=UPI004024BE8C
MLEILDVTNTGRRRRFSLAEKIRIVEESLSGPKLARATARRYGIALSGLYQWRRQYQRGELGGRFPRFGPSSCFRMGLPQRFPPQSRRVRSRSPFRMGGG